MRSGSSLQRRLGLGLTLGVTLLWLVATLASGLVVRNELDEAFDSALEETAQRILPLAVTEIVNREEPLLPQQIAMLRPHTELLSYLVRDADGNVLLQSHDVDPALFDARPRTGFRTLDHHRLYGESAVSDTIFIEVAEPLAHRRNATWDAVMALLLPLLLLIPVSLLGIWLLVRFSLQSVLAYKGAIEARGAGDLSPVTAARLPAEIEPVAQAVNQLMERLRRALESERSFTANSAHELRTPLAAALAQVQRLRRETPDGPLQQRVSQIETSLRRLVRLSEKLMQLAKAEGGALVSAEPHDVVPVLRHVVEECRREFAGRAPQLSVPEQTPVFTTLDVDAFAILVRNLLENALKYGDEQQPVRVCLSQTGVLRVSNGGPVVPEAVLAGLTARFSRAPGTHSATHSGIKAGSGLGLAIVEAIARGAGTSLTLHSPASNRQDGFEAMVQLPQQG
ncbi:histidine kinase dimerization/phospho-acceptor domain-containing protein [uncultured Oceanisphaera sp.]|uniref:sensor histidine kinase n=1 Tax=uncultured Oceanisphaera sp. TaxID=353858 RepID=UPI002612274A|nr:histidine kinase dimerization/phospho-acceptor domain-containing protein [uncultured Oceanisphaera sp.]